MQRGWILFGQCLNEIVGYYKRTSIKGDRVLWCVCLNVGIEGIQVTGGAEYGSESVLGKRGASADRETVSTMSRKDRQVLGGEG